MGKEGRGHSVCPRFCRRVTKSRAKSAHCMKMTQSPSKPPAMRHFACSCFARPPPSDFCWFQSLHSTACIGCLSRTCVPCSSKPVRRLYPATSAARHMLRALCNRAEEYGHAGSIECYPRDQEVPWNKGKLTGAKPPLRPGARPRSIRTTLQIEGRARDLAMFNLAIDSKRRGCDVVAIRVEDVAAGGYTADRATVRQRKTGRPVRFELSEQTRQAIDDYLRATGKRPGEFLFAGRRGPDRNMTTRQYARLVSEWIGSVGLDPRLFGTHSLRRTKAT